MHKKLNVSPDWGHALLTPDEIEIRIPKSAFVQLRKLGVLERNRAKLKPIIYQLLDQSYDDLLAGLQHLLGRGLEGPAWCVCRCEECRLKAHDNTPMPGQRWYEAENNQIISELKARRCA